MRILDLDQTFEDELECELNLARNAILLVATGGAVRVVVANLRHGRVVAPPARQFASEAGVSLGTLPTADPRRVDLVVVADRAIGVDAA